MGTLRFFEEVVSFKIRRTFGFADYTGRFYLSGGFFSARYEGGILPFGSRVRVRRLSDNIWGKGIVGSGAGR